MPLYDFSYLQKLGTFESSESSKKDLMASTLILKLRVQIGHAWMDYSTRKCMGVNTMSSLKETIVRKALLVLEGPIIQRHCIMKRALLNPYNRSLDSF